MRRLISTGSPFEEKFAYSRAVVQDNWCFCAGTTGYDYAKMEMPESVAEQTRNIFLTLQGTMQAAGFDLAHIVRLQTTITDPAYMEEAAPVLREFMGEIKPANTAVVGQLVSPEMKIEIEATALKAE